MESTDGQPPRYQTTAEENGDVELVSRGQYLPSQFPLEFCLVQEVVNCHWVWGILYGSTNPVSTVINATDGMVIHWPVVGAHPDC